MEYIKVLLPSIGVGLLFWYVMRGILRSDSTEREDMERYYSHMDSNPSESADSTEGQESEVGTAEEKHEHGTRDESRPD